MKINHLGHGIVLFEDILSKEMLDEIDLSLIEDQVEAQQLHKIKDKTFMESGHLVMEEEFSFIPTRYHKKVNEISFVKILDDSLYEALVEYCKIFPIAAESITNYSAAHFIKYPPKTLMGPHSDVTLGYKPDTVEPTSTMALGNTITASIFLNNEFEGGSVHFVNWDIEVMPKAGSALFYPSNYIGAHEVKEVTSGFRWVYLAFYSHGDGMYISANPQNRYEERYVWTSDLKNVIRQKLNSNEQNLNLLQKKVKNGYQ